ncbi:retaining alpha-galactosidase [Bacteroidia bacterium]|nr:retaining alpha-galactosidase [Bacteroidia bacterium]
MKKTTFILLFCLMVVAAFAQKPATLASPDGKNVVTISWADRLSYSIAREGVPVIVQTPISMTLGDGTVWGQRSHLQKQSTKSVRETFAAFAYIKQHLEDNHNRLLLEFREGFAVEFRAYNDAVAYRFLSTTARELKVRSEYAAFPLAADCRAWCPYVMVKDTVRVPSILEQYGNSFENTYTCKAISALDPRRLIFTPVAAELPSGLRVVIAESDLESYPGMFLRYDGGAGALLGDFAPCAKAEQPEGRGVRKFQRVVTQREDFIASVSGRRSFPWRIVAIAENDSQLLDNDMVYRLASPSRIGDTGWIRPGKAAWEWWNDWGLTGVDFVAGVNMPTYRHFIDFASRNHLEYVVIDEGWSRPDNADLMDVVPAIDLPKLIDYGRSKGVSIILWASYNSFNKDIEAICRHYSAMGVAGFKVDFMDRDDQGMVEFVYRSAEIAAKYHLVLDLHGMYKPTGINRTWPNVLSFEAVRGTEYFKWSKPEGYDQISYDVTLPYLRQLAGPMDYTPGAMRNVPKNSFYPSGSLPVAQGTRCRQLAMYVVFYSPLAMLCDSPSAYDKEQKCLDFIAPIPTTWDQTVPVDGRIGDFAITARRKGETWYVAGITGNSERTVELDMKWLPEGRYTIQLFCDGKNAGKIATDYRMMLIPYETGNNFKLKVKMVRGGGFAARIIPADGR